MIHSFIPISIELGPVTLYTYGLILGISVILVIIYVSHAFPKQFKEYDYLIALFFSFIGARLLFILHNLERFVSSPEEIIQLNDGGLALYGGIASGTLAVYFISKKRSVPFLQLLDRITFILPLAQAFGRIGNFVNNELYGRPTDLPWGVFIPEKDRLYGYEIYESFHPTFFYESVLSIISFAILSLLNKRWKLEYGIITSVYLINYGIIRLIVNQFRIDKEMLWFIETSDLFSIIIIIIGVSFLLKKHGGTKNI